MWIYDPDRICECGEADTAFFAQRGKKSVSDPKRKRISILNICFNCKTKERSKYYYKHDKLKRYKDYVRSI